MASMVPSLLAFSVLSCTLLLARAPPPQPPTASPSPAPTCTDELVLFSPCLSYIASPPNNLTDAPSSNCCNAFSTAIKSNAAVCFCYLLQEPPILGFPLNSTRLLSLSSDCSLANRKSPEAPSLNSLCSESTALPPLNHSANLGLTVPSTSGSGSGSSSQVIIPSKGGSARGGSSSGGRGGGKSRPRLVGGAVVSHSGGSPSEMTEICRSTGWLLLWLLSLLMSYIC